MKKSTHFKELRAAYDAAFERLRSEVRILKFGSRDTNPALVDHLRQRVKDAQSVYRQKRDDLAQFILAQHGQEFETGMPVQIS